MTKCLTLSGRHIWERCGLDIYRDRLVRLRRCSVCGATKRVRYDG